MKLNNKNYAQWCAETSKNNSVITNCLNLKKEMFEDLSDELKNIFFEETGKSPSVHFSTFGDRIRVQIPMKTVPDESIPISSKFLDKLVMPVNVGISYDDKIGTHLFFELKPDLGGDSQV